LNRSPRWLACGMKGTIRRRCMAAESDGQRWLALAEWGQAEPLMRRALEIDERSYGPGAPQRRHPPQQPRAIAPSHQPAGRGRAVDAPRAGHRRAELRPGAPQGRHPPQQPRELLQATNRLAEAEPLYRRALEIRAQLRPGAPQCRHRPQQPRAIAPSHQPAGRGRAVDAPRAGD
jgi:hypothetical protein